MAELKDLEAIRKAIVCAYGNAPHYIAKLDRLEAERAHLEEGAELLRATAREPAPVNDPLAERFAAWHAVDRAKKAAAK